MIRECKRHGFQKGYFRTGTTHWRCSQCANGYVANRRRKVKALLVAEHGGACVNCGYDRYFGSLDFHHVDRSQKEFALADGGLTRSLERSRAEAAKCVLLCRNCHSEVENGITILGGEIGSRA